MIKLMFPPKPHKSKCITLGLWQSLFAALALVYVATVATGLSYIKGQKDRIRDLKSIKVICPNGSVK